MASTCNGTSLSLIMRVYFFFLSSIRAPSMWVALLREGVIDQWSVHP